MYLARTGAGLWRYRYVLRESYRLGDVYVFRDLADLGRDPSRFIVYSDETSFMIDEDFLQRLRHEGVQVPDTELEDLLFPFVDPYIQNRLQPFRHRNRYRNWAPVGSRLRERAMAETHVIDRRRLHFLRLGRTSAETIAKTPAMYAVLLDKSRDEIEQLIMQREQALPAREYQQYLFAVFDLHRHFKESYARSMPEALNREQLDTLFVDAVCRLARDQDFWQGFPQGDSLPAYLIRYLIMYFDAAPDGPVFRAGFTRPRSRRTFHSVVVTGGMSRQQAMAIFGLSSTQLAALRKNDLTRLYRRKAHELHPDKGGESEQFIRLTAAYNELLPSLP
ncbi:J domain-containing protein [Desulfobulbus alkaliphilus]|uniref:J domain-containing protein n=1 Tax=Desulfobulbus alkaliphilus TaxID=869814 RepID=UPI0019639CF3|nr:J domain-containing protein [Desulfobulbus alkaliphilus]MBM9536342.1 J domain-containing protein [Desulfobulbus alkaliphilus]